MSAGLYILYFAAMIFLTWHAFCSQVNLTSVPLDSSTALAVDSSAALAVKVFQQPTFGEQNELQCLAKHF
jgi:hypothetical protein